PCKNGALNAAEAFIVAEDEDLVLEDRAARGHTKLILAKSALLDATSVFEEVGGVEFVVSEKFPSRAVKLVGAGFDCSVQHGSARAAILRAESRRLHFEFLNGVHRRDRKSTRLNSSYVSNS